MKVERNAFGMFAVSDEAGVTLATFADEVAAWQWVREQAWAQYQRAAFRVLASLGPLAPAEDAEARRLLRIGAAPPQGE
jgi:hypothetical protein